MPTRSSSPKPPKRPRDLNELAAALVSETTDEPGSGSSVVAPSAPSELPPQTDEELAREAARMLGRLGGLKGGKARAAKLTAEERSAIARKAAAARWSARG